MHEYAYVQNVAFLEWHNLAWTSCASITVREMSHKDSLCARAAGHLCIAGQYSRVL